MAQSWAFLYSFLLSFCLAKVPDSSMLPFPGARAASLSDATISTTRRKRRRRSLTNKIQSSTTTTTTTMDLNRSTRDHEHHRQLQRRLQEGFLNENSTTNTLLQDEWHALTWFQATRHLSRYELSYRQELGLDIGLNWNGIYLEVNDTTTTMENNQTETDDSYPLPHYSNTSDEVNGSHNSQRLQLQQRLQKPRWHPQQQKQLQHRRRLVNVSNWISNAAHTDTYQSVPLSQGYGTHLANVWVGSPHPQRKTVIVDTGSHFTAFPCEGCRNCGSTYHTDPYFDPIKSGE